MNQKVFSSTKSKIILLIVLGIVFIALAILIWIMQTAQISLKADVIPPRPTEGCETKCQAIGSTLSACRALDYEGSPCRSNEIAVGQGYDCYILPPTSQVAKSCCCVNPNPTTSPTISPTPTATSTNNISSTPTPNPSSTSTTTPTSNSALSSTPSPISTFTYASNSSAAGSSADQSIAKISSLVSTGSSIWFNILIAILLTAGIGYFMFRKNIWR